jgi:hypothetical protein
LAARVAKPFWQHVARIERENTTEKFSLAPPGTFRRIYSAEAIRKPLTEPGWCRIWCARLGRDILGHASVYDLGEPDGVVFGHISVEKPVRGQGIYGMLQAMRFAFLDKHQLTLAGPCALHNDNAFHLHRKYGYKVLSSRVTADTIWMYREPRALNPVDALE